MAYTYEKSPGGDKVSITGCDEHGGVILVAHSADGILAVPVCIAPEDLEEVREMREWSRAAVAAGQPKEAAR
jgi:hypothetical protein